MIKLDLIVLICADAFYCVLTVLEIVLILFIVIYNKLDQKIGPHVQKKCLEYLRTVSYDRKENNGKNMQTIDLIK